MPQASSELRAMFEDDRAAWTILANNFTESRGVIRPKPGHHPTDHELYAVDYLVFEWDYGYESQTLPTQEKKS